MLHFNPAPRKISTYTLKIFDTLILKVKNWKDVRYVMFDDGILGKKTQFILAIASFMHILVELY